jgi:hypothetical protein
MTNTSKEANPDRSVWNSLEICKLVATVMTSVTVFVLGPGDVDPTPALRCIAKSISILI